MIGVAIHYLEKRLHVSAEKSNVRTLRSGEQREENMMKVKGQWHRARELAKESRARERSGSGRLKTTAT